MYMPTLHCIQWLCTEKQTIDFQKMPFLHWGQTIFILSEVGLHPIHSLVPWGGNLWGTMQSDCRHTN